MKTTTRILILLAFLCQFSLAQNGPKTAEETAQLADTLYQALGPERGAVFYEPFNVLVLSGRIPRARFRVPGGNLELPPVTQKLKEAGLALNSGSETWNLVSLDAVRKRLSGQLPEGAQAWPPAGTLGDFESFEWSMRDKLEAVYGESYGHVLYSLTRGLPNSAISARLKAAKDPVVQETLIHARVPYSDTLSGQELEYRLLPVDAQLPEIQKQCRERGELLKDFYQIESVKNRLDSAEFVQARAADTSYKSKKSPREKWLSGEAYGSFELESVWIYTHHERVLAENLAELASLARANEPPYRWISFLNSKLEQSELSTPFNRSRLRRLIWTGGYPSSPARRGLYDLVSEVRPAYLDSQLKYKLETWNEANERSDRDLSESTLRLFHHPRFRRHFANLSAAERKPYLDTLEVLRDDTRVRLLLGQSPYNGE